MCEGREKKVSMMFYSNGREKNLELRISVRRGLQPFKCKRVATSNRDGCTGGKNMGLKVREVESIDFVYLDIC